MCHYHWYHQHFKEQRRKVIVYKQRALDREVRQIVHQISTNQQIAIYNEDVPLG